MADDETADGEEPVFEIVVEDEVEPEPVTDFLPRYYMGVVEPDERRRVFAMQASLSMMSEKLITASQALHFATDWDLFLRGPVE